MTFGQRLKKLRLEKNISQEGLADTVNEITGSNIKKNSISRYEREIDAPMIDKIECMADYFNVSVDYLLGRTHIRRANWYERLPDELKEFVDEENIKYLQINKIMKEDGISEEDVTSIVKILKLVKKNKS